MAKNRKGTEASDWSDDEERSSPSPTVSITEDIINPCDQCPEKLLSPRALMLHTRLHFKATGVTLVGWLISHTGAKVFQCLYCGKGFSRSSLRRAHTRNHTKSNPYECSVCSLFIKSTLIQLLVTHDSVKRYECNECGQQFFHRVSMVEHLRKHAGVLLYNCPLCKRTYCNFQTLREHTEMAHINRRYTCDVCKTSYTRKRTLTYYMTTNAHKNRYYAVKGNLD